MRKKSNDLIDTFVWIPKTIKNTPKALQYRIFDMILGPIMPQKKIELIQYRQSLI